MKIAQQALMSHDQWRECVQKCCGVIEHGIAIGSLEMCGRGACSLGLRDEGGRAVASRAADGVEAFGIVIGPSFGHVWTHGWFDGWWASQ